MMGDDGSRICAEAASPAATLILLILLLENVGEQIERELVSGSGMQSGGKQTHHVTNVTRPRASSVGVARS